MSILKYLLIGIINSITNILPISYDSHIFIYQNTFNTKIFNNTTLVSLLNLSTILAILIINHKIIISYLIKYIKTSNKKSKTTHKKYSKLIRLLIFSSLLNVIIYLLIPHKITNLKNIACFYIITSLIILFSTNKKGTKTYKELTYKDSLLIGLSSLLTFIPTISPLCSTLFISSKLHLNKESALTFASFTILPILFINSTKGLINYIIDTNHILNNSITILVSLFLSINIYNYLKKIYFKNKLYRLSIYCIILSLFIFIWFR